jgi:uncharacterized protein (UPF0548 family)
MLLFCKPSPQTIRTFLDRQSGLELTYTDVGATGAVTPRGYLVNHTRIRLGEGEKVFQRARSAILRWEQFRIGWVEACPADTPIRVGEVVAVLARSLGLWWLNACRIVTVYDEADRFGFAYGTLPDHAGTGEERFLVEWDRQDSSVWYDILAFSRPHKFLVRLAEPYMRRVQKQFGRDSADTMTRWVQMERENPSVPRSHS